MYYINFVFLFKKTILKQYKQKQKGESTRETVLKA